MPSGANNIIVNPVSEPKYHKLTSWYNKQNGKVTTTSLTQMGESGANMDIVPLSTIDQINEATMKDVDFLSNPNAEPKLFKVSC